jgi:photosystem II stability/assembly factor-like uncharacterized protein
MATEKHVDVGYLTGLITERGVIVVVAASEKLEEEDVSHTFLAIYKERSWKVFEEDMDIVSVASGKGSHARHLISLGINGEVIMNEPMGVHHEHVHKGRNGPSNLRTMNEVRAIDGHFVAVGMRRQVYRRKMDVASWVRYDDGVLLEQKSLAIAGFLSVDGFDENETYAVGYQGEIWLRNAQRWQQLDSPTSARLECVRCGGDGLVVICGVDGLVMLGRGMQWAIVEPNGVDTTLKSIAFFDGRWYLADEDGAVYFIDDAGLQPEPDFEILGATTSVLDANASTLVSIGEEDICLFNGKKWKRLAHPAIDPT